MGRFDMGFGSRGLLLVVVIVLLTSAISIAPAEASDDSMNGKMVGYDVEPLDSTYGDLTYVLINGDSEVNITGYVGAGGNVTIPSTIDGRPVTTIGGHAFESCSTITSFILPDGLTTIGEYAFARNGGLTTITVPADVMTIGAQAFHLCSSLESIDVDPSNVCYASADGVLIDTSTSTLVQCPQGKVGAFTVPDGVTTIKDHAFYASSLTSLNVTDNVTTIEGSAFTRSTALGSISIGDGVVTIGDHAFQGCNALTTMVIPDSVTTMGRNAFYQCPSLTSVAIGDNVTSIEDSTFTECGSLSSVTFGDSVLSIGNNSFKQCDSLVSIWIGDNVTTIGDSAFSYCRSLINVTFGDAVTTIGECAFSRCDALTSILISENVTSIEGTAFNECRSLESIDVAPGSTAFKSMDGVLYDGSMETLVIYPGGLSGGFVVPDYVTVIGENAFYYCNVESVTMGANVTTIGDQAFKYCYDLGSVNLGQRVKVIGNGSFYHCWDIESIAIPDSVTVIGDSAFDYCFAIKWVTVGANVTTIGDRAFDNCYQMTSLTLGESVTTIGDRAFESCRGITSLSIPDNVTTIGECAFRSCEGITSLSISDNVTSIADCAFESCYGITSLSIPDSVTSIGNYSFGFCHGLTSIAIPSNVRTIGEYAFVYCISLSTVTMSDGVETIGNSSFRYCSSLTSVTVPGSVTTIGHSAFASCDSLTSIDVDASNTEYISQGGILYNSTMTALIQCPGAMSGDLTIPDGVVTIGWSAFEGCSDIVSVIVPRSVTSIGVRGFFTCTSLTSLTFEGDAPSLGVCWSDSHNDSLTVIYREGSAGFTTPTWEGIPSVSLRVPDAPGDLTVEYGVGHVNLSWTEPFDGNSTITHYTVDRDGVWLANVTTLWYDDTTFVAGDERVYAVSAVNDIGEGDAALLYVGDYEYEIVIGNVTITRYVGTGGDVTIPSSLVGSPVTTIGDHAFDDCDSITSIELPDTLVAIGDHAFEDCDSLTSVTIPENVTDIGIAPFGSCSSLASISVADGNAAFVVVDGVLYDIDVNMLIQCPGGMNGTMDVPSSVTRIGELAFANCTHVTFITFEGDAPTTGALWAQGHDPSLVIKYRYDAEGFTTPTWEGIDSMCLSPPDVPGTPSVDSAPGYVNITWSEPFDGNSTITHYSVYRDGSWLVNVTTLWSNDTTVVAGDEHRYAVCAVNELGVGARTNDLTGNTVPAAPVLGESHGDGWANVSWTAPADGGSEIVEYIVQRNGSAPQTVMTLWFNDTTVVGVEYTYSVRAVNGVGEGVESFISVGDFEYVIDGTGVRITRYTGSGGDVTIPSTIVRMPVTEIGGSAFAFCSTITSVTIPSNVTTIGDCAFTYCTSLTSVTIGDDVTTIGFMAFNYCTSLASVTIPGNVTEIGVMAFFYCHSIESIDVDEGNPSYSSLDGVLYDDGMTTLIQCPGGMVGAFIVPEGVTTIDPYSFGGCKNITSVTIGDDVTTIGKWAFAACTSLTSITLPDSVGSIGNGTFESCISLVSIDIPDGVMTIGERTFEYCFSLTSIDIGANVTTIGDYAFASCISLTSIDLPSGLTSIGEGCFEYCESLTSIDVPDGVEVITEYAFFNCSALESVTMGDEVTIIGHWAFCMCPSLTSIALPGSVTTIERKAFAGCESLTTITIPSNVTTIEDYAFIRCTSMTSIDVDDGNEFYNSVDGILYDATVGTLIQCPAGRIGDVDVPSAVNTIGPWAFEYCTLVTSVTLPEGVTTIEWGAFEYCVSLTSITIPSNVTTVEERAFRGCSELTSMTFDGDAPMMGLNWALDHNESMIVYYYDGAKGFTTPTWEDLPSVSLSVPDAPVDLAAQCHAGHVNVTWSEPFDGNSTITHYSVYRNGTLISNVTMTWYLDEDVDEYQWYSYSVTAVNAVGEGNASMIDVLVPDTTAPTVNITSPSDGEVIVSFDVTIIWTANDTGSGIASFNVTVDGIWYDLNATTFSLPLTLDEGDHVVTVTAYDVAGNHANATVLFTVAIKPTVVDKLPTGDDVPKDSSIVIEFSEAMDEDSVTVTCGSVTLTPSWNGNIITLTHDALDANTTYNVAVNGEDAHGNAMDEFTWSFTTENVVTVTGVVSNDDGPVVNATVTLESGVLTTTDSDGRYTLTTTPGEHTITISKDGFDTVTKTVTVTASSVQTFDETLNPTTPSTMLWLGVIAALVIIAAIALVVYRHR